MEPGGDFLWICFTLTIGLCVIPQSVKSDCTKVNACSCKDPKAGTIDLSPLDGKTVPKYQDQPVQPGSTDTYLYSWNPCSPFNEGDSCQGVSGCQVSADKTAAYPIGTQDTAQFTTDASTGNLYVQYTGSDSGGGVRALIVALICDPNDNPGTLTVVGEIQTSTYEMSLNSIHCCPKDGPGPNPGPGGGGGAAGISIGSIITIAFFSIMVIYAASGVVIQKFARKASGKEIIPNYTLWSTVPGLIKDGFVFTFTCGRRASYEKV